MARPIKITIHKSLDPVAYALLSPLSAEERKTCMSFALLKSKSALACDQKEYVEIFMQVPGDECILARSAKANLAIRNFAEGSVNTESFLGTSQRITKSAVAQQRAEPLQSEPIDSVRAIEAANNAPLADQVRPNTSAKELKANNGNTASPENTERIPRF